MGILVHHPSIKGDASDKDHQQWIIADRMKWQSGRQITSATSTRGDRESSNATISDLVIYKHMDKSTPSTFIAACCGTGKDVEIHLTKTGQGQGADVYMIYKLKNAIISHYDMVEKASSPFRPSEMIKISFTAIEVKYVPYDDNNKPLAPIAVGFDTATNTKI